ncbi:MAG: type II 3-dehydroquinate dehydratase, partial [Myxococcales bacterium]
MNVLVVHGPNLNLLGESRKDPVGYAELNARLQAFAAQLGATLKIVQSNHEGVLLDAIQAERKWAQAILINPAALTHTSYALRECLRMVGLPTIEVHLEDIRRRETWRRKSVIKDVCEAQVMGKGLASYLEGLERLVTRQYAGVKKGKSRALGASLGKTIGGAPEAARQ